MSVHVRKQFFFFSLCSLHWSPLHVPTGRVLLVGERECVRSNNTTTVFFSVADHLISSPCNPTPCHFAHTPVIPDHGTQSLIPLARRQSPAGRVAKLPKPIAEPNVTDSRSSGKSRDAGWPMLSHASSSSDRPIALQHPCTQPESGGPRSLCTLDLFFLSRLFSGPGMGTRPRSKKGLCLFPLRLFVMFIPPICFFRLVPASLLPLTRLRSGSGHLTDQIAIV